jgi:hypothetical protein
LSVRRGRSSLFRAGGPRVRIPLPSSGESGANSTPRFGDQRPVSSLSRHLTSGTITPVVIDPRATHSSWQAGDAETDRLSPTERLPVDTGTPHINCSSGERAETGSSLDYIIRRGRWTHMKRRNLFEPDGELSGAPLRTRSGKRPDPESNPPRRGQRSRANRTAAGASGCWCSSRTGWSQTCGQSACPSKPTPAAPTGSASPRPRRKGRTASRARGAGDQNAAFLQICGAVHRSWPAPRLLELEVRDTAYRDYARELIERGASLEQIYGTLQMRMNSKRS